MTFLFDWLSQVNSGQQEKGRLALFPLPKGPLSPLQPECHAPAKPQGHRRIAWVILAGFLLLGVIYSLANPILESPDEIYHYGYIKYLADGHGLPVQRLGEATLYEQEGSQPPLYYLLSAALTYWADTSNLDEILVRNPHARIGIGLARDNQNLIIHSDAESWPWRGAVLAIRVVRLLSIALAAATLWAIYRLGLFLSPRRPVVALGAMGLTALNPMFLYVSSSINNDNLITLLSTIVLLQLVMILYEGCSTRRSFVLGVTLGLASLSKVSGLALFPMAILVLGLEAFQNDLGADWRCLSSEAVRTNLLRWFSKASLVVIVALGIGGWWYVRNIVLYGEITGIQTMLDIFGRRTDLFALGNVLDEFWGFRISYWGLFGAVNVIIRPIFAIWILESLLFIGGISFAYQIATSLKRGIGREDNHGLAFFLSTGILLLWIVVLHLSLLRWTLMTRASQGRLIFPAIGAISMIISWGLSIRIASRRWPHMITIVCLALFALATAVPWTTIRPAYALPPRLTLDAIPDDAVSFGTIYDGAIELAAYEVHPSVTEPGKEVWVTLYWYALESVDQDYSMYLHLFGREGQKIGFRDSHPGMGTYPTSRWPPGQVIQDRYSLQVDAEAEGPVAAHLEVGLYKYESMQRLSTTDKMGQPVGQSILARIKVEGDEVNIAPERPLDIAMGEGVRLLGYDLNETDLSPGDVISLALYWETAPLQEDYQVFIHLVSADGALLGQGDGPILGGEYPTRYWGAGERLIDHHQFIVSQDAPMGESHLYVGLYSLTDGHRLPVLDEGAPDSRILLTTLRIVDP